MSVYKKLNAVRLALHSMELKKSGWNSYSEYHYFELADFLIPALKLLDENGLCGVVIGGTDSMRLIVIETDGDGRIEFAVPLSSAKLKASHEVQNLGAVITYSRRYLWTLALEILEHDAVDASEPQKPIPEKVKPTGKVAQMEFDKLPEAKQSEIRDIVLMLGQYTEAENYAGAFETLEEMTLDADDKLALWSQLDSKTRSALKRISEKQRDTN